jgi:hypothetical protein
MFADEIEALRKIILERQESEKHKRHVRARASASISLGVIIASALGGGVWLDRGGKWEGIKSYYDQTKAADNATVEVLPNTLLLEEVFSIRDQTFIDHALQGTVDFPLGREELPPAEERFVDYRNKFDFIGSQNSTAAPGPINTIQQAGLPAEKPNEKSTSTDIYGVQLASVFTEHDASKEKARLSRKYQNELENLSIFVESATNNNVGTCYRIMAGKTDKESATETCRRLSEIGKECLLVKVEKAENRSP